MAQALSGIHHDEIILTLREAARLAGRREAPAGPTVDALAYVGARLCGIGEAGLREILAASYREGQEMETRLRDALP